MKLAVVLFNLGGPDTLDAVEPFLANLFSDPAVLPLPSVIRKPLASWIAKRRSPIAREIYSKIGGRSPILEQTEAQAQALALKLSTGVVEAKAFIAMRAWKPFARDTADLVAAWKPDRIVLLPLYPQFSTTTTASSIRDWQNAAQKAGLSTPTSRVCCYPWLDGFTGAEAALIANALIQRKPGVNYRLLLSAHGLPKRVISKGDPYQWQVEKTAQAVVDRLGTEELDWRLCYQSRVGPMAWIGPATDDEVRRAGRDGLGLVVAPIAFVSEHSETLVELDIEYRHLARACGVADYIRVPTVGTHSLFIDGLASIVLRAAANGEAVVTCESGRVCPRRLVRCGYGA